MSVSTACPAPGDPGCPLHLALGRLFELLVSGDQANARAASADLGFVLAFAVDGVADRLDQLADQLADLEDDNESCHAALSAEIAALSNSVHHLRRALSPRPPVVLSEN